MWMAVGLKVHFVFDGESIYHHFTCDRSFLSHRWSYRAISAAQISDPRFSSQASLH